MRARRKGTNNPYTRVEKIQLQDLDILYNADVMEFEQPDTLSTELKTYEQMGLEDHWQDVRERATIAAMQGMLANPELLDKSSLDYRITIERTAVGYANKLVEQLKKLREK